MIACGTATEMPSRVVMSITRFIRCETEALLQVEVIIFSYLFTPTHWCTCRRVIRLLYIL